MSDLARTAAGDRPTEGGAHARRTGPVEGEPARSLLATGPPAAGGGRARSLEARSRAPSTERGSAALATSAAPAVPRGAVLPRHGARSDRATTDDAPRLAARAAAA